MVNARKVAFGVEFDLRSLGWVVFSTSDVHHVDSVIEIGVLWTNDGAVPAGK